MTRLIGFLVAALAVISCGQEEGVQLPLGSDLTPGTVSQAVTSTNALTVTLGGTDPFSLPPDALAGFRAWCRRDVAAHAPARAGRGADRADRHR